jgi:hypothetical protein
MRWIVSFSICLLLVGCADSVNVRGDTPEPYHLSRCTQEFMKAQHAAKALPRCVAVDWNEVTDLNLKLEARRKLEAPER